MTAAWSWGSYETSFYLGERNLGRAHANEYVAASKARLLLAKQLPQHPLHPIAIDRAWKHALGNDDAKSGNAERIGSNEHAEPGAPERRAAREQRGDIGGPEPQPSAISLADAQTLSRARPLARRARITARPPRVRMRTRNP